MLNPQVIPTPNVGFNGQPFGSNTGVWGSVVTDGNWALADAQLGGSLAVDLTGVAAYTLTDEQAAFSYIKLTGTPESGITLTIPNRGRQYIFNNASTESVFVVPYAGTGTTLGSGVMALVRVDMTQSTANLVLLGSTGAASIVVGTTAISGGTSNGLLYNNAGVLGNLATENSGVLVTDGSGTPSISTTLPNIALGTPTSATLTHATGLPVGGIAATGTPSASTYLRGDGSWISPGTVSSGTAGQLAYYATTSNAVSGNSNLTVSGGALTIGVAGSVAGSLKLSGATSGTLTLAATAVSGSNTITFPAGTTNFSATGGASQVVQQSTVGGAFTVGQLSAGNLSNGTTGSGAVVLATSPAISGGTINGATIGATTASPGAFTTLSSTGAFTPSQISGIVGTTTNNDAAPGSFGEYIESVVFPSAGLVNTNNPQDITHIDLTPGDWDVTGLSGASGNPQTVTQILLWVSPTSATIPSLGTDGFIALNPAVIPQATHAVVCGTVRFSIAANTRIYLSTRVTTSTGQATLNGIIRARRVR